ncbi:hypothetical protein [Prosthecobacter sp.]|uniref:hypothetical protein n=1 Tax=Prosthecobacter sp. TaxID=1965333 RepID=UPI003783055B
MSETSPAELILERFCGREVHPVVRATWNLYRDEDMERMTLCINLKAGTGTTLHEDTQELHAKPSWEINLVEPGLVEAMLVSGAEWAVPEGYDESRGGYVTNFYYCSHEPSDDNHIHILAVDGDRLLLSLSGETIDVNFYDGSKAPTKLFVKTWFSRDDDTCRSMS